MDAVCSSNPTDLGGLPEEGDSSKSGPGEQQVSQIGHVSKRQSTRLSKSYWDVTKGEIPGRVGGILGQEAWGGWTQLSSNSHETSLCGGWWATCKTLHCRGAGKPGVRGKLPKNTHDVG